MLWKLIFKFNIHFCIVHQKISSKILSLMIALGYNKLINKVAKFFTKLY